MSGISPDGESEMEENKVWRFVFAALIIGVLGAGSFSCNLFGPKHSSNGDLTLEDVACVKTWLKISFGATGGDYELKRDGSVVLTGSYAGDTVVVDTTVEPSRSYRYEAELISDGKVLQTSSPLEVTTLDTTSSEYTFRTWEIGGIVPGSYLNDVTIINDTDIWAVGEINIKDSSGAYGAIHWNGRTWTLKRVPYFYQGQVFYDQMLSVFALSAYDIFVGGNGYYRWNGTRIEQEDAANGVSHGELINGIWAGDDNEVYIVESQGGIGYFTGATWRSLSSGTTLPIQDVYGNKKGGVYCIASNTLQVVGTKVLEIRGSSVSEVTNAGLPWSMSSVWVAPNSATVYAAGDGIFVYRPYMEGKGWKNITGGITRYYSNRIRGEGLNDIAICGASCDLAHFNGVRWKDYLGEGVSEVDGNLYGLAMKGNTICAVGSAVTAGGVSALIVLGKRN